MRLFDACYDRCLKNTLGILSKGYERLHACRIMVYTSLLYEKTLYVILRGRRKRQHSFSEMSHLITLVQLRNNELVVINQLSGLYQSMSLRNLFLNALIPRYHFESTVLKLSGNLSMT